MRGRRGGRAVTVLILCAVLAAACSPAPAASPGGGATPAASGSTPGVDPSATPGAAVETVAYADTTQPAAAADRELDLVAALREESGMAALLGPDGGDVFGTLDALTAAYGRALIADLAVGVDTGELPLESPPASRLDGLVASLEDRPPAVTTTAAIDTSLFADTGFTASASLAILTGLVQRAAEDQSGSLPRQETHRQTDANGLSHVVELSSTITIRTGGGRVHADVIMAATDSISNPATGSFVALYTSRSTGSFDVNACPDANGIGAGTYTFETRQELNEVGGAASVRSVAGRSVDAPFELHNGDDAHLTRIEADLALTADAAGPGSPSGPGPTGPFDWSGDLTVHISMPATGSTTTSGAGGAFAGTGSEAAGGSVLLTSGMAQLFLGQIAKEAESFWRSGKCIELVPDRDSGSVSAGEAFELSVQAKEKFGGGTIEKPIVATFSGKASLSPVGQDVLAPETFRFTAGSVKDDKGTIDLLQTSNRGIGKRQVVYTVGEDDYRVDYRSGGNRLSGTKCGGRVGEWVVTVESDEPMGYAIGTYTFTLEPGRDTANVVGVLDATSASGSAHWDITGTVTFVPGTDEVEPRLDLGAMSGQATIRAGGQTATVPVNNPPFSILLEAGEFC